MFNNSYSSSGGIQLSLKKKDMEVEMLGSHKAGMQTSASLVYAVHVHVGCCSLLHFSPFASCITYVCTCRYTLLYAYPHEKQFCKQKLHLHVEISNELNSSCTENIHA